MNDVDIVTTSDSILATTIRGRTTEKTLSLAQRAAIDRNLSVMFRMTYVGIYAGLLWGRLLRKETKAILKNVIGA